MRLSWLLFLAASCEASPSPAASEAPHQLATTEVSASVSADGLFASVSFTHLGRFYQYNLSAFSVYSTDAEVLEHTERGQGPLARGPARTFRSRPEGRWASATFHDDGSVSGLFEDGADVIRLRPPSDGLQAAPGGAAAQPPDAGPAGPEPSAGDAEPRALLSTEASMELSRDPVISQDLFSTGAFNLLSSSWRGDPFFPGCFRGDSALHTLNVGIFADVPAWQKYGRTLQGRLEQLIAEASFIFEKQIHVRLEVAHMKIYKTQRDAPGFARGCPLADGKDALETKLLSLEWAKDRYAFDGVVQLITGCEDSQWGGVSHVGTLCDRKGFNTAVVRLSARHSSDLYMILHEMGHLFGAHHSFQEGVARTGGIMDWGNGRLDGYYQFNSKYNRQEMCATIDAAIKSCGSQFTTTLPGIAGAPSERAANRSRCSSAADSCRKSMCCKDPGLTCYEKDAYWASCRSSCLPGSFAANDPLAFRVPWSCKVHECAGELEDCRKSRCCKDPSTKCYQKDATWASCRPSCVPGSVSPEDPPMFQTPWMCKELECSEAGENCRGSGCCKDRSLLCFEKDSYWASCRKSCEPGSVSSWDPPHMRTPWSCKLLHR